jgi:hypothetical protein
VTGLRHGRLIILSNAKDLDHLSDCHRSEILHFAWSGNSWTVGAVMKEVGHDAGCPAA